LRSRCDVLPVLIRGTHDVMGKGSLVPRRHPVEVRIGRVLTAAELRELAQSSEGAGAYRKIADLMRTAVIALSGSPPKSTVIPVASAQPARSPEPATQARSNPDRSPERPRGHAKA
jgi:hypothetical protein